MHVSSLCSFVFSSLLSLSVLERSEGTRLSEYRYSCKEALVTDAVNGKRRAIRGRGDDDDDDDDDDEVERRSSSLRHRRSRDSAGSGPSGGVDCRGACRCRTSSAMHRVSPPNFRDCDRVRMRVRARYLVGGGVVAEPRR